MLRLRTLGGLTIEDESGPLAGAIARKRSLALLALVAMGTEQGVSRDRILAYLWPESDTDRARNNLKQTLFQLRLELREDVFVRAAGVLRLNPSIISVDACEFQAALSRDNASAAVTLYQGPFLDGFHLPGLMEFERWVDSERAALATRYAGALESLAQRASRVGDYQGSAQWWRRLAGLDPFSSRYALGLMVALSRAGERSAALEHARVYQELVQGEFGTAPEAEVLDYVKQLRGMLGSEASTTPKSMVPAGITVPDGNLVQTHSAAEPTVDTDARAVDTVAPPASPSSTRIRAGRWVVAVLGLLVLAGLWWGYRTTAVPRASPDLVAVFPFNFTGTAESRMLGNGMVDLMSASLDGAGQLRTVHPSAYLTRIRGEGLPLTPQRAGEWARRLGAQLFVLGDIVGGEEQVHLSAALYERGRQEPVAHSSVEGKTLELFQLVDRLAADLIASRYGDPHQRLTRVAAASTGSLPALKAYLEGEAAYREGRYAEALEALEKAVKTDSTFALGYYRLSDAADRSGRAELAQHAAEQALRYRNQLGERERRLIEAQHAWRRGEGERAERLCRSLVADYPEDLEAWLQLGQVLVHGNPLRGRSSVEARAAFEQVLARDPENGEALIHLARIASIEGNRQEVDTLVRRVRATIQATEVVESRAFRAFALGDRPGQKRVTQHILSNPGEVPAVTALEVAVMTDDLDGTERFGRWLTGASQAADLQGYGHRLLAQAALARGQRRRALAELEIAARQDPVPALELRSLFAVLSFIPVPGEEVLQAQEAVRGWNAEAEPPGASGHTAAHTGIHPFLRFHRLGLLGVRLGDRAGALQQARALDQAADSTPTGRLAQTLAQSIRAHLAAQGGRTREALVQLDRAKWEPAASVFVAEAYDRYLRADLLARVGREDEALGWFRSIAERAAYELVYLAPSHLRQAQIYDTRGDRGQAAQHYRRFVELWREADPELQPTVQKARERLALLDSALLDR